MAILFLPSKLFAQSAETSFEFMLIGSSSRSAAMAEAFTAVGGDAGSPFYNPATLGLGKGTEFSFMHLSYLNDVTQEAFNLRAGPSGYRSGLGIYYGTTGDIERRADNPTDEPLGTFDEHNFTASYMWAIPVGDKITIGNAIKWAYQKIDIDDASALALDFGGTYSPNANITLGASFRNLGTKPKFIEQSFDLPREFRVGAAYEFRDQTSLSGLLTAADLVLPQWGDKEIKINLGGEYLYQNLVVIRSGYGAGYESKGFAAGAGIIYQNYFFDYAFTPAKHNLSDMHRFTLRVKL